MDEERIAEELGTVPNTDSEAEEQSDVEDNGAGQAAARTKKNKVNYAAKSVNKFLILTTSQKKAAKSFQHFNGSKSDDCITWTILGDQEQIVEDPMVH